MVKASVGYTGFITDIFDGEAFISLTLKDVFSGVENLPFGF